MSADSLKPRMIVGLGNPGPRYADTWHNIGWLVVDDLARRWRLSFSAGRFDCQAAEKLSSSGRVALIKPTTYMNLSGDAVGRWSRYYKILPEELLIVFDDHDLPLGRLRLRTAGSAGGHRGMQSIIDALSTREIPRLRIGIAVEGERVELADQVLSRIGDSYKIHVEKVVKAAADAIEASLSRGLTAVMNLYNREDVKHNPQS